MKLNIAIKRKMVKTVLLTPIISSTTYDNIDLVSTNNGELIISSQEYCGVVDEDMSDIAIKFYEVLYSDIFKSIKILNGKELVNIAFAGDTMNSYNRVSKNASDDKRTELLRKYHCLANFWVVPAIIGRNKRPQNKKLYSYTKSRKQDSMVLFLKSLKTDWDEYNLFSEYKDYFNNFKNFQDFCTNHFLQENYVNQEYKVNDLALEADDKINQMLKNMDIRAEKIIENDVIVDNLYRCFKELGIIKNNNG